MGVGCVYNGQLLLQNMVACLEISTEMLGGSEKFIHLQLVRSRHGHEKISMVYCLEYMEIPEVFFIVHHGL